MATNLTFIATIQKEFPQKDKYMELLCAYPFYT